MLMKDILVLQGVFSTEEARYVMIDLENISIPEVQSTIDTFSFASLEQYSLLCLEHGMIA
jgi:hypothetical protein